MGMVFAKILQNSRNDIIEKVLRGIKDFISSMYTCLLAKINRTASLSSSSANILISSSLVMKIIIS